MRSLWVFLALLVSSVPAAARVSSPGNVIFSDANILNPTVLFESTGTYVLQLTASDGVKASTATITVTVNSPFAMPKLCLEKAIGIAGTTVSVPVSISTGSVGISSIQFDLGYGAGVSSDTVTIGPAAQSAGKSLQSNFVDGRVRVLVFGLNQSVIQSGVVAIAKLRLSAFLPAGDIPVTLSAVTASDAQGMNIPLTLQNNVIGVTPNGAPQVSAGENVTLDAPGNLSLSATALDDGAPNPPGQISFRWDVL